MRTIHSDFFDYMDDVWQSELINHHKDDLGLMRIQITLFNFLNRTK